MPLTPGTRLGPYEIVAPLGAGGMGEVYRAHDTRLARDVAIKVLPQHLSSSPEVRARFEREARTVSSLNHPHICTLHDVGREGETDYLVMELVEGETLATRLAKGALPTADVLRLGAQIADALDRAHRAGVIHRDLKPGNVMLTRLGIKLMDFGLARATGMAGPSGSGASLAALTQSPTLAQPLTAEGTIVGTFQYMSPEQLEGKEADARSDLWALGCVLYEMATGKRAFDGRSQASLIGAIMNQEPAPITLLAPMSPPALESLVKHCLAKNPDDRWQSAGDLKWQLSGMTESGSLGGPTSGSSATNLARGARPNSRWMRAAAGILLVGAASGATLIVSRLVNRDLPLAPIRFEVNAPPNTTVINGTESSAISPDGRLIVFVAADSAGESAFWIRPLDSPVARRLEGTENANIPFWSPDSRWIGFFAGGKLKKVAAAGGLVDVVCDAPDGRGASWSRDNFILLAPTASGPIFRVSADGGTPTVAMAPDSARGEASLRWPAFLPDGKHYLFVSMVPRNGNFDVCLASVGSRDRRDLLQSAAAPVFAPPHDLLFVRNGRLLAQRFDPGRLRMEGQPRVIEEALAGSTFAGGPFTSGSNNGILLHPASGPHTSRLEWLDRSGKTTAGVGAPPGHYSVLSLSPDARRVVVARDLTPTSAELWMIDLTRSVATRFSFTPGIEPDPAIWSPDGVWVAYTTNEGGHSIIHRRRADGSGDDQALLQFPSPFVTLCQWAPDGGSLLFAQPDPGTGWDVFLLPLTGDPKPRVILASRFNEGYAKISPDGRWIAFTSDESGRAEAYVDSYPNLGNRVRVSLSGALEADWSRDERELLIITPDFGWLVSDVSTRPRFSVTTPRLLFRLSPENNWTSFAPDFKRFLTSVNVGDASRAPLVVEVNWASALKP